MEREMKEAARAVEQKMLSDFRQKLRQAEELLRPYLWKSEGEGYWSSLSSEPLMPEERVSEIEARIAVMAERRVSGAVVALLVSKALE